MSLFTSNASVPPETYYKSCDGLFHLQKTTSPDIFDKACEIALKYGQCKYAYIKNLVQSKCSGFESIQEEPVLFPSDDHENIRGAEYYKTH